MFLWLFGLGLCNVSCFIFSDIFTVVYCLVALVYLLSLSVVLFLCFAHGQYVLFLCIFNVCVYCFFLICIQGLCILFLCLLYLLSMFIVFFFRCFCVLRLLFFTVCLCSLRLLFLSFLYLRSLIVFFLLYLRSVFIIRFRVQ